MLRLPLKPVGRTGGWTWGNRGSSEEQNTWDKLAGFGSRQGRGGMAVGVKSGSEGRGGWLRGTAEWSGGGRGEHLIWIGSSQPNVSAGFQHAW